MGTTLVARMTTLLSLRPTALVTSLSPFLTFRHCDTRRTRSNSSCASTASAKGKQSEDLFMSNRKDRYATSSLGIIDKWDVRERDVATAFREQRNDIRIMSTTLIFSNGGVVTIVPIFPLEVKLDRRSHQFLTTFVQSLKFTSLQDCDDHSVA